VTEKDRRANSVRVLGTFSSGASDDRRGRTGTAVWIKSFKYAGGGHRLERQRRHLVCHSMLDWQPVERPEKWSDVGSTSLLADDPGYVVLRSLQYRSMTDDPMLLSSRRWQWQLIFISVPSP